MKGQAVTNFIAEFTFEELEDPHKEAWEMYVGGSMNIQGSGARIFIFTLDKTPFE